MLSTKAKLNIARALNVAIVGSRAVIGRDPFVQVRRKDVNWRLDLNEGIDLAIYLGLYQKVPQRVIDNWIKPGSLVLDIGANIGSHALPLARQVGPQGRVIAVEPTVYAFSKLSANADINPDIKNRLILVHAALNDGAPDQADVEFYSRWPLHGQARGRHDKHLGQLEAANGARSVSLDALLEELRSDAAINMDVTFIKMDVDGHELQVLRGASDTFRRDKPAMLIEIAPYIQDESPGRLEALIDALSTLGYCLETDTGKPLPNSASGLRNLIKDGASIDAVALPR